METELVTIDDVWDSTTAMLARRRRPFTSVALLAFLLPFAIQGALKAYGGASAGAAALAAAVSILAAPLVIWGVLTVVALASDAATTRAQAGALARRRIPAALLVALVAVAVALLAILPIFAVLAASGYDFQAAARSEVATPPRPGALLFLFLYGLVLVGLALWAGARLFLINAVVVLERRGIGAFGRSFALTRGLAWKLVGVNLLFAVVWGVAALAARSVVFSALRLLLGADRVATAAWFGSLADAGVTAAFIVVVGAFAARLYVAMSAPMVELRKAATGPWG